MSMLLNEALLGLSLRPGERRHVVVQGLEFEILCKKESIVDEGPMISLDFSPPPSDRTYLVKVVPTPMEYPRPFEISESDLAPE